MSAYHLWPTCNIKNLRLVGPTSCCYSSYYSERLLYNFKLILLPAVLVQYFKCYAIYNKFKILII